MSLEDRTQKVDQVLDVVSDVTSEYIIKLSIVEFPFLGLPIIKQMYSYIIQKVVGKIKDEEQLFITFAIIDSDVQGRKKEYDTAVDNLKEVLQSPVSEERKNEALEETKKRLRNLIRFPSK